MIETINMAAIATVSELTEKYVHIEAVENRRDNPALTNAISEGEDVGESTIPFDISILSHVDKHEEPQKDEREASNQEFLEHNTVFTQIKGLRHIHAAGEHSGTMPGEVADSLDNTPGTHSRGTSWLVCKLQFIKTKSLSKECQDYPINQFQD